MTDTCLQPSNPWTRTPTRDPGVDWLGHVPAHWEIVPPTALFTESKERAQEGDQLLSATQKYGVIPLAEFEALEQRQVTMAVVNLNMRKHVELGDFVISMRSMDGGLERARAVGSVRSSYAVLKPGPNVEGRFYGALMKTSIYIQALRLTSNFIRDGQDLNFSHVRKVKLPKPDIHEQAVIADYIEAETGRIDGLIEKKTRFIALLKEKRAAVVSHAVTKGIDPDAQRKYSGVEWIGKVPENWLVGRLRDFSIRISTGPFGSTIKSSDYTEGGTPILNPSHYADGHIEPEFGVTVSSDVGARLSYWALKPGDLIAARRGELGRCAVIQKDHNGWICGTGSILIQLNRNKLSSNFAYFFIGALFSRAWLDWQSVGSTMPNLNEALLGNLPIVVPNTIEEQEVIVGHVNQQIARIDALITKTEQSIALLKEKRAALITAAVTGKIDVRSAA